MAVYASRQIKLKPVEYVETPLLVGPMRRMVTGLLTNGGKTYAFSFHFSTSKYHLKLSKINCYETIFHTPKKHDEKSRNSSAEKDSYYFSLGLENRKGLSTFSAFPLRKLEGKFPKCGLNRTRLPALFLCFWKRGVSVWER